ncbi:hypothetical protein BH24ACT3_BH24ACT3_01040 [soil metagenome]
MTAEGGGAEDAPGDEIAGYRLEGRLGQGGTGEVWRARTTGSLSQVVAVKRLRAGIADADALRGEAMALAKLDHPHVLRVLEVVDDGAGVAVVMQHARGGSLADLLAERGPLEAGQVVAVLAPLADAAASAHRNGIVHGDVKPANVLFTSDGQPLLSDFGAAGRPGDDAGPAGTVGYVAPEVGAGSVPTAGSDVYALGVVCYQALTGALPHQGATDAEVMAASTSGRRRPLSEEPGVPAALAVLVEQALDPDPATRPADAEAFAAGLRAAVEPAEVVLPGAASEPGAARSQGPQTRTFGPRPPRPPSTEPVRGRRAPLLIGALVTLFVFVLAVVVWRSSGDDEDRADPPGTTVPLTEPEGCPPAVPPTGFDGEVVGGDLDGDGCPTAVVYADAVMVVPAATPGDDPALYRFATTRPGDVLLLGDWDCDGVDSPGFYRPGTGDAFYFDRLAAEGEEPLTALPSRDTGVVDGRPEVVTGDDGCDVIDARERA